MSTTLPGWRWVPVETTEGWRRVIEAALWCYYCPDQGGYRHDGDRDGRSAEDTFENLVEACEELGARRDDHPAAWMSEEDAETEIARVMAPFAAAPHHPIAQPCQCGQKAQSECGPENCNMPPADACSRGG